MFINKWFVTDSIDKYTSYSLVKENLYLCLKIGDNPITIIDLLKELQQKLSFSPFAILFTGQKFGAAADKKALINAIVSLFFHPCYYTINLHPVIFFSNDSSIATDFAADLEKNCINQGTRPFFKYFIRTALPIDYEQFPFCQLTKNLEIDPDLLIKRWTTHCMENDTISENNLLIEDSNYNDSNIHSWTQKENKLKENKEFLVATFIYEKQKIIEQCRHELYLKSINEKNIKLYLDIQKEGRAEALKWYFQEYETLPIWYKQFGHIIKVIIGKRSFKSLFSDNVKKYKD